jgi:hypothetical protein
VLRALAEADRHEVAETSARLTDAQRLAIENEIQELELKIGAACSNYAEEVAAGASIDPKVFEQMIGALNRKVETNQARLAADDFEAANARDLTSAQREKRVQTFLDIMTVKVPEDPQLRALRARLFQRVVHRIEIEDSGSGPITMTLYGHLVPEGASLHARDPISASADLLDALALMREDGTPQAEATLQKLSEIETALPVRAEKAVSSLIPLLPQLQTTSSIEQLQRRTLQHDGWSRRRSQRSTGGAAWRKTSTIAG